MTLKFRFTLVILSIALSPSAVSATGADNISSDVGLVKMIQLELIRVGYDLENVEGVLDKSTIVAITKFQANKGMEITGKPSPQLAGILQAEQASTSSSKVPSNASASSAPSDVSASNGLSIGYLNGHWCTERTQERALYNFAADGSYRLGVVGLTITQFGGVNYFPETRSRQSFLDKFSSVTHQEQDRFTVILTNGSKETLIRGNCFE